MKKLNPDIEKLFTEEQLKEATLRLCKNCQRNNHLDPSDWKDVNCHLHPLCSDSSDCPYFNKRKEVNYG